jgi:predicted secreted hydrolase
VVFIDDWSLRQSARSYAVRLGSDDFALDLLLTQTQPPLLQGDAGYSRKGADPLLASYYYSLPQLHVQGEVSLGARRLHVTGTAWFDHEWSSTLLDEQATGWDWLGINRVDGGALTAFRIRDAQGNSRWSSATQRSAAGGLCSAATSSAAASRSDQSIWKELRRWRSPRTGISYPVEWRVMIEGCEVILRPLFDDQESDSRASTGTIYWEGAVRAFDPQGKLLGHGYLELTGYGSRLRL